jgi:uncharacterized protein YabE (DUF348 family)/3D (Asp-Asp-Asp) domain-containing protein
MKIKRTQTLIILISLVLLISVGALLVFRQKNVTLEIDGNLQTLTTRSFTVGNLLKDLGVVYSGVDEVDPPAASLLTDGMKIVIQHSSDILILDGTQETRISSSENIPLAWLQLAQITLDSTDRVFVDGEEIDPSTTVAFASQHQVVVHRPLKVTLIQDGVTRSFTTPALTVGEALDQANVELKPTDRLEPPAEAPLLSDTKITLLSSRELSIQVDGKTIKRFASADTVAAALAQVGLSLQGLDTSVPSPEQPLPLDGNIRIIRVSEVITLETETIPFETVYEAQANVNIDTQAITQFGQSGLSASRMRIRYEDGQETARVVESKQVLVEPVPQIEGFGTKITVQTMDTPDGPVEYYRALDFYATSYYPKMTSPPWFGAVACGGKWQPGYVAVDLNYIPCGTRLYIPGYGFAVAMDTAYISGAWIDLGYPDDAYVGWHRHVTVYFLTPVPASVSWVIPPGSLY